jgi:hypothetical protein
MFHILNSFAWRHWWFSAARALTALVRRTKGVEAANREHDMANQPWRSIPGVELAKTGGTGCLTFRSAVDA